MTRLPVPRVVAQFDAETGLHRQGKLTATIANWTTTVPAAAFHFPPCNGTIQTNSMVATRFGLQGKIVLIFTIAVVCVVGVSTLIAMWLTRLPVETDIYRRALAQARLTAHQSVEEGWLQDSEKLLIALRQVEHDMPDVKQSDVFLHRPQHHLVKTTNPGGEHLELDNIPDIEKYNEFERPDEDRQNQIAIETPDGKFWIIGTSIRDHGQVLGCLVFKVSKSSLNAVTSDLVLRNLLLDVGEFGGGDSCGSYLLFAGGKGSGEGHDSCHGGC